MDLIVGKSTFKRAIIYDTETTGLDPETNELLSLAIIGPEGETLFYRKFKPEHKTSWPEAQAVNGISPEDVKGERPVREYLAEIQEIFNDADLLVTYNGQFDDGFLAKLGVRFPGEARQYDVMAAYSEYAGKWDRLRGQLKRHKLTECASAFGYEYHAHDALEDAKATLWAFKRITGNL